MVYGIPEHLPPGFANYRDPDRQSLTSAASDSELSVNSYTDGQSPCNPRLKKTDDFEEHSVHQASITLAKGGNYVLPDNINPIEPGHLQITAAMNNQGADAIKVVEILRSTGVICSWQEICVIVRSKCNAAIELGISTSRVYFAADKLGKTTVVEQDKVANRSLEWCLDTVVDQEEKHYRQKELDAARAQALRLYDNRLRQGWYPEFPTNPTPEELRRFDAECRKCLKYRW